MLHWIKNIKLVESSLKLRFLQAVCGISNEPVNLLTVEIRVASSFILGNPAALIAFESEVNNLSHCRKDLFPKEKNASFCSGHIGLRVNYLLRKTLLKKRYI
ncbi:hypothetical protein CEXT_549051 [Caerostris extrusa]|uniref:Uncharacterized protein n=1 Tax=Caerostris extrusa TaxID=172846 RepID=A0AAV4Y556_CAEEX|nr:hypothetical protein CEXT_549051 [Caerostris extrusa]